MSRRLRGGAKVNMSNARKYKLEIELSDKDAEKLLELAGSHGLTVSMLVKSFLNDLVNGDQSNGSDERDLAEQWFNRCCFGMFPDETFLHFLIVNRYADILLDAWDNIQSRSVDVERYKIELETGIMHSLDGHEFTWRDLFTNDSGTKKPAYSSKEEWEAEVRQEMQDELREIESCKATIHEYWDMYCAEKKGDYVPGSFDEEMQKVHEWREACNEFWETEINSENNE